MVMELADKLWPEEMVAKGAKISTNIEREKQPVSSKALGRPQSPGVDRRHGADLGTKMDGDSIVPSMDKEADATNANETGTRAWVRSTDGEISKIVTNENGEIDTPAPTEDDINKINPGMVDLNRQYSRSASLPDNKSFGDYIITRIDEPKCIDTRLQASATELKRDSLVPG
ncbi:hypothetical protein K458DRAFT_383593 [Lentithecium fluviatile CBS 122367]|uniref:Uncharacterized protein n=1 Tax=Lentithecium fluviatile CBS 122367 TaxID=1168545 RepID=A0A6G1JIV4_9PLEO|nr:hypothetical protein K458DRAFT_383593 [Lentithecium fluviatile CBS 122367]